MLVGPGRSAVIELPHAPPAELRICVSDEALNHAVARRPLANNQV